MQKTINLYFSYGSSRRPLNCWRGSEIPYLPYMEIKECVPDLLPFYKAHNLPASLKAPLHCPLHSSRAAPLTLAEASDTQMRCFQWAPTDPNTCRCQRRCPATIPCAGTSPRAAARCGGGRIRCFFTSEELYRASYPLNIRPQ